MNTPSELEIARDWLRRHIVRYICPHCQTPLESLLERAGTLDDCPACNKPHSVPGQLERLQIDTAQEEKRRAANSRQKAALLASEERKKEKAAKKIEWEIKRAAAELLLNGRYCPQCGAIGKPKTITPGSNLTSIFLLILVFPLGILYAAWRSLYQHKGCGTCGNKGVIPLDSPMAMEAIRKSKILEKENGQTPTP